MDAELPSNQIRKKPVKVAAPDIFGNKGNVENAIGSMAGRVYEVLRNENTFNAMEIFKQWRSDYLRGGLFRTHPSLRREKIASEDAQADPLGRLNHHKIQQDDMELSQMAVGWLMREGWVKPYIAGKAVAPETRRVEGKDRLMHTLLPEGERMPDWNQGYGMDDDKILSVFLRTAGYGMARRQATEGRQADGFDSKIGAQAGRLLASMGGKKRFLEFKSLTEKALEGSNVKPDSTKAMFLTAAAVGWRLAEDGVELRGAATLGELKIAPRFSQDPKIGHKKILDRAHDVIDHLRDEGSMPLNQLTSTKSDKIVEDSILIGYLAKKRLIEFKNIEGDAHISVRN